MIVNEEWLGLEQSSMTFELASVLEGNNRLVKMWSFNSFPL